MWSGKKIDARFLWDSFEGCNSFDWWIMMRSFPESWSYQSAVQIMPPDICWLIPSYFTLNDKMFPRFTIKTPIHWNSADKVYKKDIIWKSSQIYIYILNYIKVEWESKWCEKRREERERVQNKADLKVRFSLTEDYRQAKMTASRLDSINVNR